MNVYVCAQTVCVCMCGVDIFDFHNHACLWKSVVVGVQNTMYPKGFCEKGGEGILLYLFLCLSFHGLPVEKVSGGG